METHFIKTLCNQKVKAFLLSTFMALNVKWIPRYRVWDFSTPTQTEFKQLFSEIIFYSSQPGYVNV